MNQERLALLGAAVSHVRNAPAPILNTVGAGAGRRALRLLSLTNDGGGLTIAGGRIEPRRLISRGADA
jgi:hypothetical protein